MGCSSGVSESISGKDLLETWRQFSLENTHSDEFKRINEDVMGRERRGKIVQWEENIVHCLANFYIAFFSGKKCRNWLVQNNCRPKMTRYKQQN